MQDVLRAGDVATGLPEIKKAGLGADKLAAILGGKPLESGSRVKLFDFMDAATKKPTRTWMGDNPAGGRPAPIDVHAARDIGFIDQTTVDRIRQRFGNRAANRLKVDIVNAPSEYQTQYGVHFYEGLADWLNQNRIKGGNWTPAEAQAVGWVATLKQFGLPVESAKYIFSKNVRRISYEVSFGEGSPYSLEFKPLYELPYEQSKAIPDEVGNIVSNLVAKETGSRIVSHVNEPRGYLQYPVQPSIQLDVLDSPETVRDVADSIGYLLQQSEMMISRTMPPTSKGIARPNDFAIDILPAKADDFRDGAVLQGFWNTLQGLLPEKFKGFAPCVHNGKLGIRIVDRDRAWKTKDFAEGGQIYEMINKAAEQSNINIHANPSRIDFEFASHNWKEDQNGTSYLDSLGSRGRGDLAQRVVDTYRPIVRNRLTQAFQKHTQGGNQGQVPASEEAVPKKVGYPSLLGERGPPSFSTLVGNIPDLPNPPFKIRTFLGKK